MKYIAVRNQKAFMTDIKCVYKAATLNAAGRETELDDASGAELEPDAIANGDSLR